MEITSTTCQLHPHSNLLLFSNIIENIKTIILFKPKMTHFTGTSDTFQNILFNYFAILFN